jgi:hypothetical protein
MSGKWNEQKALLFVQKYRAEEYLWNVMCSLYKKKVERAKAYRRLLEAMNDPEITVNDAKAKIKSLRTTFHKKINDSCKSGIGTDELHKPALTWFEEMDDFVRESLARRNTQPNLVFNKI